MLSSINSIDDLMLYNPKFGTLVQRFNLNKEGKYFSSAKNENRQRFFWRDLLMFDDPGYFSLERLMSFDLETIIDYLQKTHSYYIDKKVPEIENSITQLNKRNDFSAKVFVLVFKFFEKFKKAID